MSEKPTTSKPQQPVKGDDRNLVAADPSGSQASVEEWLFVFWKKYKITVIAGCVLVVMAILGRAAWDYFEVKREADVREAFAAADSKEALLAFSGEHAEHPLGAVARLNAGDTYYSADDFSTARNLYAEAADMLEDRTLADRARLGQGMAAMKAGDASDAEAILRALGNDPLASEGLRAEAWYHLASMAHGANNIATAREALTQIDIIAPTGIWASRASGLRGRLPAEEEEPVVSLSIGEEETEEVESEPEPSVRLPETN